ncbi:hypothetical protein BGW39_009431 [Mortierella sp. 14UC]|nr:hypothetical protein BGW39_009431 [Mortierella sp. 14UC]
MQFSTLFSLSVVALAMTSLLTEVQAAPAAPIKRSTPLLPKCDIVCTMEYAPICAVSTKNGEHSNTFSNKCALSVFNCENPDNTFRAVSETACDAEVPKKRSTPLLPKCNIACTKEYAPICAVSTKNAQHSNTFSNKCVLSAFNCENPDNTFRAISETACDVDAAVAAAIVDDVTIEDFSLEEQGQSECGNMCMMVMDPVCAKDKRGQLRAFNNICLLNQYKCKHPSAGLEAMAFLCCENTKRISRFFKNLKPVNGQKVVVDANSPWPNEKAQPLSSSSSSNAAATPDSEMASTSTSAVAPPPYKEKAESVKSL